MNFQTIINLFLSEKRLLIKFGKLSGFKVKRYYNIENEHLIYYDKLSSQIPKGIINLNKCTYTLIDLKEG